MDKNVRGQSWSGRDVQEAWWRVDEEEYVSLRCWNVTYNFPFLRR